MASKAKERGEPTESPRASEPAHGEIAERPPEVDASDAFRSLQPGETIAVHRLSPSYAQGYLDHIVVPHGEELDIMSELKGNWGGGRFQLKAKRRAENGKMVFSGINATVTVAGDPTLNGQVYRNGRLVDPEPQHAAQAPHVVYAPPQQPTSNPMDPVNARILGFVETALQNGGQSAGGGTTDIVGLIGALRETLQPARAPAAVDPFAHLEKTMALLGTMQERFGGNSVGGGDSEGGGMTGLGSGIESLLMQKILGGAPPPQQPPWQQPTQQWMQQQWGGPPGGPPGAPSMGGPPGGPTPNWPNAPGQVPWQQGPPNQGAQPPPGWTPPPGWQPPAAQAPAAPTAPPPPKSHDHDQTDDDDDDEEGPFSVDNLMGELESMEPNEREKFVTELAQRFGIDEQLGKQIFPNGMPQQPNAAGPGPDFTGLGTMPGTNPTP